MNTLSDSNLPPAPWMTTLLKAAGIYNLTWGSWVVLFPEWSLRISGYPDPVTSPQLWQCIGMIVGVYGIGYWIAASDPFRHWPIVLVGFLGKIFGPLGFLAAWLTGQLPLTAGRVILLNDIIWWIPFSWILWKTVEFHRDAHQLRKSSISLEDALHNAVSQQGKTIAELSQDTTLLLIFLRHSGCTFCRQMLSELAADRQEIEAHGVRMAFVHLDPDDDHMQQLFQKYQLDDLPRFSDVHEQLYEAFEVGLATPGQLLHWKTFTRGFWSALIRRHGFSTIRGNVFRLQGAVLIRNGKVIDRQAPQSPADHPDFVSWTCSVE